MAFFEVKLEDGSKKVVSGAGLEDALESVGLTIDTISSYDDTTEREFEK